MGFDIDKLTSIAVGVAILVGQYSIEGTLLG